MLRETKQVAEMYKLCDIFAYVNANAQKQVTVNINILEVSEIGSSGKRTFTLYLAYFYSAS